MGLIDWKMVWRIHPTITCLMACLMLLSLLTIGSHSLDAIQNVEESFFFTPQALAQLKWFGLCWVTYFFLACVDYRKLREWTWLIYLASLGMLVGVFFTDPIANVHRWYRVPMLGMSLQPSESSQIAMIMALSWYLERSAGNINSGLIDKGFALSIALVPFMLILKQPDLGSALVIYPIVLGMFYMADVYPGVRRWMGWSGLIALLIVLAVFLGIISHEGMRPLATQFLREYQYERLNPGGYHNVAGQTAVALGGFWGKGWRQGVYSNQGWLPEPYTDSIFASMSEEFGCIGACLTIGIYAVICWHGFRVAGSTKDIFGQLLAAGLSLYLSVHAIINIAMMLGLLPITGVPLPLMSYGGSSSLTSAAVLGILQSIWTRRFMF